VKKVIYIVNLGQGGTHISCCPFITVADRMYVKIDA